MLSNIEIKARMTDWEATLEKVAALADAPPKTLKQEDIFFTVPRGRLKLRTENGRSELIYYLRENSTGPRESSYVCLPVADADAARRILATIHGQRAIVRKTRWLYMIGQTRIHFDRVENLGDFLEMEVVLRKEQSLEEGTVIARKLLAELGIGEDQLVDRAYVDLL